MKMRVKAEGKWGVWVPECPLAQCIPVNPATFQKGLHLILLLGPRCRWWEDPFFLPLLSWVMPTSVSDLCNEVVPRILSPVLAPHRSCILLFGGGYYNSGTQNFPKDTATSPLEKCSQLLSLPVSNQSLLRGSIRSLLLQRKPSRPLLGCSCLCGAEVYRFNLT